MLGASVLTLAALGVWRTTAVPSPDPGVTTADSTRDLDQRRIAVLYFDDLTGDAEAGRIARGLTEDVIDELGQVRGLRVISPNGVRPFRDRTAPMDSIARVLGVGTIVGGSVSASGNLVRTSVRMLDPRTGEQLQSRTFETPRTGVLQLRSDVTTQVALFLRQRLGEEVQLRQSRGETSSLEAWELVSHADELVRQAGDASHASRDADARDLYLRADSFYVAAQRLDAQWPRPVLGRGWVAVWLAIVGPGDEPLRGRSDETWRREMMSRAVGFADEAAVGSTGAGRALALRGFAREWLGTLSPTTGVDTLLRLAEADLLGALDERPDDARSWYALGDLLLETSRFTEASTALTKAYEADAYLVQVRQVLNELFFTSLMLERDADARRWCELGVARYPEDPRFQSCAFIRLARTGHTRADVGSAWRMLAALESGGSRDVFQAQWGFNRLMVAGIAARAGLRDSARALLDLVRARRLQRGDPLYREAEASVFIGLGQPDSAARLLVEEGRSTPLARARIARTPWLRSVVADPRFAPELSATGGPGASGPPR